MEFALLVTKTLNYPVSLGHFLETVSDCGSEEEFLEERFRRVLLEAFVVREMFSDVPWRRYLR